MDRAWKILKYGAGEGWRRLVGQCNIARGIHENIDISRNEAWKPK
jgi:hypothetical protein